MCTVCRFWRLPTVINLCTCVPCSCFLSIAHVFWFVSAFSFGVPVCVNDIPNLAAAAWRRKSHLSAVIFLKRMTAAGMVRIATLADVCLNMDGTNTYMFVYPSGEVLEVNASQMATVGQGMALVIPAWEFRCSTDVKLVLMDGDMFARDDDQVSKILHLLALRQHRR